MASSKALRFADVVVLCAVLHARVGAL